MKAFFTGIALCIASYTMAATDSLHAGVYTPGKPQKIGILEKRQIISGTSLDVKNFQVYTLTLPAGKKYTSTAADSKFVQLIIVKSGTIKLTVNDTTKTVGPGSLALVLVG